MKKLAFVLLCGAALFAANVQKKPYDYVKEAVKNTSKYSVIVLGTDYCPFCKMTMEGIQKLDAKYDAKTQFFYVNIDFDDEAKSDYAVHATPNILFFAPNGKLIDKKVGGMNEIGFAKKLDAIGAK
jgi:thiol-disulfide isomerase/thioredoxin